MIMNLEEAQHENPNLVALLRKRLPELGLDEETYGGYVLGIEDYEEELEQVVELLQASAEEEQHTDHPTIWKELHDQILESLRQDETFRQQKEAIGIRQAKEKLQAQLDQEKQKQSQSQQELEQQQKKDSQVDEATKQALLSRFAYEEPDEDPDGTADGDAAGSHMLTNAQVAAQASLERARELRSHKVQTKKEEQQKTKQQKASKDQLKDERRKRALKGERKR